jgi:hypothetical protein
VESAARESEVARQTQWARLVLGMVLAGAAAPALAETGAEAAPLRVVEIRGTEGGVRGALGALLAALDERRFTGRAPAGEDGLAVTLYREDMLIRAAGGPGNESLRVVAFDGLFRAEDDALADLDAVVARACGMAGVTGCDTTLAAGSTSAHVAGSYVPPIRARADITVPGRARSDVIAIFRGYCRAQGLAGRQLATDDGSLEVRMFSPTITLTLTASLRGEPARFALVITDGPAVASDQEVATLVRALDGLMSSRGARFAWAE